MTGRGTSGAVPDEPDQAGAGAGRALDRQVLRLAVPALGTLVAEPLFLLVDQVVVGRLGTDALAGAGAASAVLLTAVGLCVFLAYGTTASVARSAGAGDRAGALGRGVDGLWLALALGGALALLGLPAAPGLVDLLGTPAAARPDAVAFLRWSLPGLPGMLLVLAASGVLRGLQDTVTPLRVALVAAVVNAPFNVLLVHGLHRGAAGSATGTSLVQLAAGAVLAGVVLREARRAGARLRPDLPGVRAAATAGVPLLVRTLTLRAAVLSTTWVAARLGGVELASHSIAFAVWSLLALALDALAIAAQALVGHALGAGDAAGARAVTRRLVRWGAWCGAGLGLAVVALRPLYVPLFTPDPAVHAQLSAVLVVVAVLCPLSGVVFVLDGVLIGAGDGRYLAAAGVLTLLVQLPLAALVAAAGGGLVALWGCWGAFVLARAVTLVLRERTSAWAVPGAAR